MFGFSLAVQLFQGSAERTWNCVAHVTHLLWYKFNNLRHPNMPRSRRRHHSRSRSRSRSHSHDRDREPKRRKIVDGAGVESPLQKRSVSCEPSIQRVEDEQTVTSVDSNPIIRDETEEHTSNVDDKRVVDDNNEPKTSSKLDEITLTSDEDSTNEAQSSEDMLKQKKTPAKLAEDKLKLTPQKSLSPKQLQKRLESEKKKQLKQQEREDREKKRLEEKEEKERQRLEKLKEKKEKDEQKQRERAEKVREREMKEEQRRKEKEEKEAKRKEREEREEQKRKERELEKQRKQQEIDEKQREKQKIEEQNKKAAAAFVNFFSPKKITDKKPTATLQSTPTLFMPFQLKSGMRLPPQRRDSLTNDEKEQLTALLSDQDNNASYLVDLKVGKKTLKCAKTQWTQMQEDQVETEDFGEKICETLSKCPVKIKAKLLKFHDNQRPAYYGTWRKASQKITPRKPLVQDPAILNYEYDSDDDWEEEEQGESLNGSDEEEEKDPENEENDYEVDNEFFVPHGHLSDDELDDELTAKLSPESQKQKLKLLKDEFEEDMKAKTNKMKPRSIGCIWYDKDGRNVDESIDRHLKPLAMITNGPILIQKREFAQLNTPQKLKDLSEDLIPMFLNLIHGNTNNRKAIVDEFVAQLQANNTAVECSKTRLGKKLKEFAQWKKCDEPGPMLHKLCWIVEDDIKKKYNVELSFSKSAKK